MNKISQYDISPEQIEALDKLQASKNDGRGISHVEDIVEHLRRGYFEGAENIARWDNDKTRAYPDVKELIYNIFPSMQREEDERKKKFGWD